jgi:hypothetical protein
LRYFLLRFGAAKSTESFCGNVSRGNFFGNQGGNEGPSRFPSDRPVLALCRYMFFCTSTQNNSCISLNWTFGQHLSNALSALYTNLQLATELPISTSPRSRSCIESEFRMQLWGVKFHQSRRASSTEPARRSYWELAQTHEGDLFLLTCLSASFPDESRPLRYQRTPARLDLSPKV